MNINGAISIGGSMVNLSRIAAGASVLSIGPLGGNPDISIGGNLSGSTIGAATGSINCFIRVGGNMDASLIGAAVAITDSLQNLGIRINGAVGMTNGSTIGSSTGDVSAPLTVTGAVSANSMIAVGRDLLGDVTIGGNLTGQIGVTRDLGATASIQVGGHMITGSRVSIGRNILAGAGLGTILVLGDLQAGASVVVGGAANAGGNSVMYFGNLLGTVLVVGKIGNVQIGNLAGGAGQGNFTAGTITAAANGGTVNTIIRKGGTGNTGTVAPLGAVLPPAAPAPGPPTVTALGTGLNWAFSTVTWYNPASMPVTPVRA
jgi:hypothetical protein